MKNLILVLVLSPFLIFANDQELPSKIEAVTIYLSGAEVSRSAICNLHAGTTEVIFTGLSHKIDEGSIQISGLQGVSILSMSYDIDYLVRKESSPESDRLESKIERLESKIALFKNKIAGLTEEEQVLNANRTIGTRLRALNLENVKEISTYYRERVTAIKDEIFSTNLEINKISADVRSIQKQMAEMNNAPEEEEGRLIVKFHTPMAAKLNLKMSYTVSDAGWIPNYDIKSKDINAPLNLTYKAHVYQKTGKDWDNVKIVLSTGNPNINVSKPNLGTKFLNFTTSYRLKKKTLKIQRYVYNPSVKKVTGTVLDESGAPLPGANVAVRGSSNGTQTDFDGHFSLDVQNGQELAVSYLGFHDESLPIYSSVMNIRLEEDASALEEVVVTGLGAKRENHSLGYAVSSVNSEDIGGRTPGVKIRGISSIKSKKSFTPKPKSPLYVIDGTVMEDFIEGDLDEKEIQSIDVLKGINATNVYGYRGANGVVVITTKKSRAQDDITNTKFIIKKPYTILSDGDITAIEINTFKLGAKYEYFAAPVVNENVFLTTTFSDWEKFNLLPGETNIYFKGGYAGKTTIDPYTTKKEMTISLGIDPNITVTRLQNKNFKSKSFIGSNRLLRRVYDLEIKNNKAMAIELRLMDRIPISQNKEIKVEDIETNLAEFDSEKGMLTWQLKLSPQETKTESFSFTVKYPRYKRISI